MNKKGMRTRRRGKTQWGGGDGVEKMNERGGNLQDMIKEEVGGGAGRGEGVEEDVVMVKKQG